MYSWILYSSILSQFLQVIRYCVYGDSLGIRVDNHTKESLPHFNVAYRMKGHPWRQPWRQCWIIPRYHKTAYCKLHNHRTHIASSQIPNSGALYRQTYLVDANWLIFKLYHQDFCKFPLCNIANKYVSKIWHVKVISFAPCI